MWLEKFPVHFLYKIKVSEVFSFLIRNSRVFFKFFGGRNKEANDKMISFCRAGVYLGISNFQEKRVAHWPKSSILLGRRLVGFLLDVY